MALKGGDPDSLVGPIVQYSAKHVRAGKLIGGYPVNDVMSRFSHQAGGHFVTTLPNSEEEAAAAEVHDALWDRCPGPAEEAACRVDYADWLARLSEKQRAVAEGLASGFNVSETAKRRGVSRAAVQDIRKTLARKWDEHEGGEKTR